VTFILQLPI